MPENSLNEKNEQMSNLISTSVSKETLISTAVHFLQNPRVKNVSLDQKRAFLIKKGLTNEDVDKAFEKAGHAELNHIGEELISATAQRHHSSVVLPQAIYHTPSLWTRWRELCSSILVIGATGYGFYYAFKQYIEPLIIGKKRHEEDRMTKIERHLMELNRSLSQLRHSLVCVESALSKQKIQDPSSVEYNSASSTTGSIQDIIDLKAEVASIKSLLLSRKQFPIAPTSSLSIPTWQLKEQDETENNVVDITENEDSNVTKDDDDLKKMANGVMVNGDLAH